jgi:hypothetical protein
VAVRGRDLPRGEEGGGEDWGVYRGACFLGAGPLLMPPRGRTRFIYDEVERIMRKSQ